MSFGWKRVRAFGRPVRALHSSFYHWWRFAKYAGWRADYSEPELRNYAVAKTYHAVEKSMAFRNRRAGSGWANAFLLMDLLRAADQAGNAGHQDQVGLSVLREFVALPENAPDDRAIRVRKAIGTMDFAAAGVSGAIVRSESEMLAGRLEDPEQFFLSRYSLREFRETPVDNALIERAVRMAMKSPSVCNRQEWHVYRCDSEAARDAALALQSGNRGFGDRIPNLLIVSTDLTAFMPGQEHYQPWIDGGLFAMALIHALHALGMASCCLNWSQTPAADKALRRVLEIRPEHTIIMMLAVGHPDTSNKVCESRRRPIDEVYSRLQLRNR